MHRESHPERERETHTHTHLFPPGNRHQSIGVLHGHPLSQQPPLAHLWEGAPLSTGPASPVSILENLMFSLQLRNALSACCPIPT